MVHQLTIEALKDHPFTNIFHKNIGIGTQLHFHIIEALYFQLFYNNNIV